jgi:signal transduction histidine kinase
MVHVDVEVAEDAVAVAVTDHGPGMPVHEQQHIFERFWRARNDGSGAGLGLAIAKQIALAHGGDLTLRSPGPAGDGCVFELRLRADYATRGSRCQSLSVAASLSSDCAIAAREMSATCWLA